MKHIIFTIILLSFVCIGAYSQDESLPKSSTTVKYYEPNVPKELHTRISDFFKLIIQARYEEAYRQLLQGSPLMRKEKEINRLIEQTEKATQIYGAMRGFEAVDSEVASNSMIKCRYLGLHTLYPMRWIFTYYNSPENGWVIINIKFDDQSDFYFRKD
ncbi:MAG TPA: hypothetical protein PLU67_04670 [Candidatus Kapabacteria bacterium]|jgi:hypothetical protein|nr:hypothetical protein [Candidatus Kapabacteria bacterium]HOM04773.1 hypothetical protein [Candidatus Kapabacteria bacterium]HPP39624.1 hypothetical protein [Candidatus Kapabacteria bacterium]HPU23994.1 hypothetical protein [Candidatus Kapabacteria bacterium]